MKKPLVVIIIFFALFTSFVSADTFGTGSNQFTIDFVPISSDASSANGTYTSTDNPEGFVDPGNYRMGTKEITNDQWTKFKAAYGTVTGSEWGTYGGTAYDQDPYWAGENIPTNNVSWYEAAQFVNYLNTSTGNPVAYKFTGTQGTGNYTFGIWSPGEADGTNLYRNKNAKYFLPTENEWVKAAYWNGTSIQTYATKAGESLYQGNGSNGGWNYYNYTVLAQTINLYRPWDVGSGSQELNGTYDMMGNLCEWMESPSRTGEYLAGYNRGEHGGSYGNGGEGNLGWFGGGGSGCIPVTEASNIGFRVASIVPEPTTLLLLSLGGLLIKRKR